MFTDEYYMKMALQEAEAALEKDEVPIGVCSSFQQQNYCKSSQSH